MPNYPLARDLIKSANDLIEAAKNQKPRQANLRRATSTAYYALFHCLAHNCANSLIGNRRNHGKKAWRQAYRALQHKFAKSACDTNNGKIKPILERFPDEIQDFANQFYSMQIKRHDADYDPHCKFEKSTVITDINAVESVIDGFENTPILDRKAFAALVLFQRRD